MWNTTMPSQEGLRPPQDTHLDFALGFKKRVRFEFFCAKVCVDKVRNYASIQ